MKVPTKHRAAPSILKRVPAAGKENSAFIIPDILQKASIPMGRKVVPVTILSDLKHRKPPFVEMTEGGVCQIE